MWTLLLVVIIVTALLVIIVPLIRPRQPWELSADATGPVNVLQLLGAEKEKVLRQLKDLETERESGAMSDEDYTELRAAYLGEAALLNRRLEALQEGTDEAESPTTRQKSVAAEGNE